MSMVRNLLDLIYSAESGQNYDAWNTQTKIRSERPLTELTVSEIMAIQDKNKDNDGGAAGAGQIKKSTMQLLLNNKILSRDDKFTPEVQDRAHLFLLQNRGLNDFLSGQIDLNEYGHRLSKEYASLPSMKGKTPDMSYYEGEAKNSALVKPAEINAQLSALLDIDSEANLDLASVVEPTVVLEAFVPTAKKPAAGQYLNQAPGITSGAASGVDPRLEAIAAAVMEAKKGDPKAKGYKAMQMALGIIEDNERVQDLIYTPSSKLNAPQERRNPMDRFSKGIAGLTDRIGNLFGMEK